MTKLPTIVAICAAHSGIPKRRIRFNGSDAVGCFQGNRTERRIEMKSVKIVTADTNELIVSIEEAKIGENQRNWLKRRKEILKP